MDPFGKIVEDRIREAIKNGEFHHLPGFGKPHDVEDLSHIPEQLRIGYLALKNAGMLPDEESVRKDIKTLEQLIDRCDDEVEEKNLQQKLSESLIRLNAVLKTKNTSTNQAFKQYQNKIFDKLK